jgi:hypothetical protein
MPTHFLRTPRATTLVWTSISPGGSVAGATRYQPSRLMFSLEIKPDGRRVEPTAALFRWISW